LPLLLRHQKVKRAKDLTALPPPANEEEDLEAAELSLMALGELVVVATAHLHKAGWELNSDEKNEVAFVNADNNVMQSVPPSLGDNVPWEREALLDLILLLTPKEVRDDGSARWPLHVRHFVRSGQRGGRGDLAVLDVALLGQQGALRQLHIGPWRGMEEMDPVIDEVALHETRGENVESWLHTTVAGLVTLFAAADRPVVLAGAGGGSVLCFLRKYLPDIDVVAAEPCPQAASALVEYFSIPTTFLRVMDPSDLVKDGAGAVAVDLRGENGATVLEGVEGLLRNIKDQKPQVSVFCLGSGEKQAVAMKALVDKELGGSVVVRELRQGGDSNDGIANGVLVVGPPAEALVPARWQASQLAGKLPFKLSTSRDMNGITHLEWSESDGVVQADGGPAAQRAEVPEADDMWACFGSDDEGSAGPEAVVETPWLKPEYWAELGGGLAVTDSPSASMGVPEGFAEGLKKTLEESGYVVSNNPVLEKEQLRPLIDAMQRIQAAGWPPVAIFCFDMAWNVLMSLWDVAETILGPCSLEPSFTAFRLNYVKPKDVGNNFGLPHRDYAFSEALDDKRNPKVLSVWFPLNDITTSNGCMYIVPRENDPYWEVEEKGIIGDAHLAPNAGIRALAPYPAGTFMAWYGNTVHWGSGCLKEGAKDPRASFALVFRRADVAPDEGTPVIPRSALTSPASLHTRLRQVEKSLDYFAHWYPVPADVKAKLAAVPKPE